MQAVARRRLPLVLFAALVLASSAGASGSPLSRQLAKALAVPHVSRARTAALVFDLQTGTTVFARHDSLSLAPASNEKLAVTYAALVGLGPDFRFDTDVVGRGEQDGSVWRGSLLLVGHGDPTLSYSGLVALAQQVRAAGIRRVTGAVLGDESYFDTQRTAPGWKSWFYITESPPLSALTVDRCWYAGRVWRNPALGAAVAFRTALHRAGVSTSGAAGTGIAPDDGVALASIESQPLATVLRWMDHASDNFTAELVLKQLGTLVAGQGTTANGAVYVRQTLAAAGIPLTGVRLVDGSGLSLLDRVTTRELAAILETAWADPDVGPVLFASLPVAGVNGTLSDRMRRPPARGNVVAKTGTTSWASALSGYVKRRYVFSVLQNGNPVSALWARRAQDRFATVLAAAQ
jgi:D-alanyl-D-alanine carboxypeptidase/D-alanyl-D-alanine-endopeptidase (penicillin-binding protein 4)